MCAIKDCTSGVVRVCFVDETVLCLSQPSEDQELVQSLNYSKYSHADRVEQHIQYTHPADITLNIHVTFNNLYLPFRRERGVYEHRVCTCR